MRRRFLVPHAAASILIGSVLFARHASMADEATALAKLAASLEPGQWGERDLRQWCHRVD